MELQSRYDLCHALIQEAGALAQGYFNNLSALTIKSKGLQDMVSEADLNTEVLIKSRIAAAFPQDAFLGEETGVTDFTQERIARKGCGDARFDQHLGVQIGL